MRNQPITEPSPDCSFEKLDSNGSLAYWVKENITTDDGRNSEVSKKDGSYVVKINGNVNGEKSYSQTIDVQGNPNDTYIVSGWAAAFAVSSNYHSHYEEKGEEITDKKASEIFESVSEEDDKDVKAVEDSKFEIDVSVIYKDENGNTKTQHKASAKFNTSINIWQYSSAPVVLKYVDDKYSDDDNGKTYTPYQLKVSLVYTNQANYAFFDHIQLVKDVAQSYTYDDEGNVVSVSANAEQKNDMTYDPDSNDLKKYTDAGGNTTTFDYEENTHNLTKVTSPKGVKTQYTYNDVGLNTVTETVNTGGAVKIKTTKAHTDKYETDDYTINPGAYVRYSNDQHGYTTTYGYDMPTGAVMSVTSPNGLVTSSIYNSTFSKLIGVSAQNTSVNYTYDKNKLTSISFGYGSANTYNEKYNFEYDEFGNVLSTKVDTKPLSTNTYLQNNGGLDETVYGNNDGIKYGYNYSGNVTAIYYKDNANGDNDAVYKPAFTWQYSSDGTPRVHKDGYAGLKYNYSYDAIGRLIRTDISNSADDSAVGSTEYGYNTRGHLISITNDIGGNAYGQYYSYSEIKDANGNVIEGSLNNAIDGLPTRYKSLGVNTDYAYDSLNRLTRRNVDLATDIQTLYTYKDSLRGTGYTTTQLATEKLGDISYGYSYDNMGNITSIVKGSNAYRSYMYDSLGQLTQERNVSNNTMTSYSYNHLGNITAKHINDYNGINEKAIVQYGYSTDSDAGWKYLLTSITTTDYTNDSTTTETIDYDAIGNPISYRGAAMAWKGRQLTGYAKNGVTSTFKYDADGLRSSKTVGGVKTEYQYVGDQLFYEKRGDSQEFYYFYDSYGNLSKIYYTLNNNGTTSRAVYHALTNAQGDVVALYNSAGSLVAQYEYDAWGNTLSVKDASGAPITAWYNIAVANPIRYRGYYYDSDLGLYYLQSRYYDSEIGRFINADDSKYIDASGTVLGGNLFAYCENNPVMYCDPSGEVVSATTIVVVMIVAMTLFAFGVPLYQIIVTLKEIKDNQEAAYEASTGSNANSYTIKIGDESDEKKYAFGYFFKIGE